MNKLDTSTGIGINWSIGSFYGWGVFGLNLAIELIRSGQRPVALLRPPMALDIDVLTSALLNRTITAAGKLHHQLAEKKHAKVAINATVIQPAVFDFELFGTPAVKGAQEVCFIFFENATFTADGIARANSFPRVLAGSKWNADVLTASGVANVRLAHQGVDISRFHDAPRRGLFGERFAIFAGGKLEYRKGQDIIVAAFRKFHSRHPDAILVTNWQNQFHHLGVDMSIAGHVQHEPGPIPGQKQQGLDIARWMIDAGIPANAFLECGLVPNKDLPSIIRECDAAIFTSRAEGGTNLAAMECLACGVPTILSANTGHLDLIDSVPCWPLTSQTGCRPAGRYTATDGWGESDVDEIVETLETIYRDREAARLRAQSSARNMTVWSWTARVENLISQIEN